MAAKQSSDVTDVRRRVEAPDLRSRPHPMRPRHGFFIRLYTGTGAFDVIGRRKVWFVVSGLIVAHRDRGHRHPRLHVRHRLQGRHHRVDARRRRESPPSRSKTSSARRSARVPSGRDGRQRRFGDRADPLGNLDQRSRPSTLRTALFDAFHPKGADGQPRKQAISDSAVSSTWGGQITKKALIALVVFLVLVGLYIMIRYERYMAIAALASLVFDLITTAGVYALIGFEVTPATLIGLLTIMGFSLYDTVIVFDKVRGEHPRFRAHHSANVRRTGQPRHQPDVHAVDQHQPDLDAPVLSLMVVAVWLLGVGTLKDLALVMLVGVMSARTGRSFSPPRCW